MPSSERETYSLTYIFSYLYILSEVVYNYIVENLARPGSSPACATIFTIEALDMMRYPPDNNNTDPSSHKIQVALTCRLSVFDCFLKINNYSKYDILFRIQGKYNRP